ncbi:hypothetical protein DFJ73DRAFT_411443 [Zopfochytrium polystomum]|nr:hypothetical protein DFJ73DRAFT_411443 [Zopfochytrium polystomum]
MARAIARSPPPHASFCHTLSSDRWHSRPENWRRTGALRGLAASPSLSPSSLSLLDAAAVRLVSNPSCSSDSPLSAAQRLWQQPWRTRQMPTGFGTMRGRVFVSLVAVLLALVAVPLTDASPFFNTPNDQCVSQGFVPTRYSVTCPVTCVDNIKKCPSSIVDPALANCRQTVCADGTCQSDCTTANENPVCNCPRGFNLGDGQVVIVNPVTPLVPCNLKPQIVNVPQYLQGSANNTANANAPLWSACTAYANANSSTVFSVTSSTLYNECAIPSPSDRTTHIGAPEFLVAYVIFGMEIAVLVLHFIYKKFVERKFRDLRRGPSGFAPRGSTPLPAESPIKGIPGPRGPSLVKPEDREYGVEMDEFAEEAGMVGKGPLRDPNLTFKGYRPDAMGAAASATATITSILWIILLAVLVLDYYSVFARFGFREESDMIFYDHSLLSKVFIMVWHFVTFWFVLLKIRQDASDSFYGKRVALSQATFVVVEKRMLKSVPLANEGALVSWVRRTEASFRAMTG